MRPCLALLLTLTVGCSAPQTNERVASSPARTVRGVAPRYQPLFEALRDAVDAGEDETARRIAVQLRARLASDRQRGVSDESIRDSTGLLQGFEKVLQGRALVDSLRLELSTREVEPGAVQLVLRASTVRRTRIELHPGAASLRVLRVTLSPSDGGKEGRGVRTESVTHLEEIVLDDGGWVEFPLGSFSTSLPGNVMAARTRWTLRFRAGEIREEGIGYPAMDIPVAVAERVDLAPFLPTQPVDPVELATYAQRHDLRHLPLLERTVRIHPDRREEALDLLTPVVRGMPEEELMRLVPTLRWLAPTSQPGRDPLAWRSWLEQRAAGSEDETDRGALDLGSRRF